MRRGGSVYNQTLIDEILNEVYKRLEDKCNEQTSLKKLIFIGPMPDVGLKYLKQAYKCSVYKNREESYEGIVITKLTIEMLGHLATSSPVTEEESLILKALLNEKQVYMLEEGIEYRRYKENAHKALYTLLMDYEDKIKNYGIQCISHLDELLNSAKSRDNHKAPKPIAGNVNFDMTYKKLLLEADLIKKHLEGICIVTISKGCIITPLADDYIRKHHIEIKRV